MGTVRRDNAGLIRLQTNMADMDGLSTKVGWFDGNNYPDGPPVAYVASIQEFGDGKIPPRSFMRTTIVERQTAWQQQITQSAVLVATGRMTAFDAMDTLGQVAEGDVRAKIASITDPPLSTLTLAVRAYMDQILRTPRGHLKGAGELRTVQEFLDAGLLDLGAVSGKPLVYTSQMIVSLSHTTTKS